MCVSEAVGLRTPRKAPAVISVDYGELRRKGTETEVTTKGLAVVSHAGHCLEVGSDRAIDSCIWAGQFRGDALVVKREGLRSRGWWEWWEWWVCGERTCHSSAIAPTNHIASWPHLPSM